MALAFEMNQTVGHDLGSRPELNGQMGSIIGYDLATSRFIVRFGQSVTPAQLEECNLRASIFCNLQAVS